MSFGSEIGWPRAGPTRTYTRAETFLALLQPAKSSVVYSLDSRESAMKCGRHFLSVQPADEIAGRRREISPSDPSHVLLRTFIRDQ